MILEFYIGFRNYTEEFSIEKNEDGWTIGAIREPTKCDKKGNPVIFEYLDSQSVDYPPTLRTDLQKLWYQLDKGEMDEEEVQSRLDELGRELKSMNGYRG